MRQGGTCTRNRRRANWPLSGERACGGAPMTTGKFFDLTFTTETGRWTTSPAAMRSTTSLGRGRIFRDLARGAGGGGASSASMVFALLYVAAVARLWQPGRAAGGHSKGIAAGSSTIRDDLQNWPVRCKKHSIHAITMLVGLHQSLPRPPPLYESRTKNLMAASMDDFQMGYEDLLV